MSTPKMVILSITLTVAHIVTSQMSQLPRSQTLISQLSAYTIPLVWGAQLYGLRILSPTHGTSKKGFGMSLQDGIRGDVFWEAHPSTLVLGRVKLSVLS